MTIDGTINVDEPTKQPTAQHSHTRTHTVCFYSSEHLAHSHVQFDATVSMDVTLIVSTTRPS